MCSEAALVVADLEQRARLLQLLQEAEARAQIAADAYARQQEAQRDWESRYAAMTERAMTAETERDYWQNEHRVVRTDAIRLLEDAQAMMRPQAVWEAALEAAQADAAALRDNLDEAASALLARPIRTDFDKTLAAQMRERARGPGSGAALHSELLAVRALADALLAARSTLQDAWPETRDLRRALAAYETARKAREE